MPIVDRDENLEFLIDAIPGMRERINTATPAQRQPAGRSSYPPAGGPGDDEENSSQSSVDPLDVLGRLQSAGQELYATNPMTNEQRQRMGELSGRESRLAPAQLLPYGSVGSGRIAGNPYSIDTRGAAQAAGNLGLSILNRVREGRRDEFEGELNQLRTQAEQNTEARESRDSFYEKYFPEMYSDELDREFDNQEREDEQEFKSSENQADRQQESTQNRLEREHDKELTKIENSTGSGITTGDMSNLRQMTQNLVDRWDAQVSQYNNNLSEIDKALTQAQEQGQGSFNGSYHSADELRQMQEDMQLNRDRVIQKRDRRLSRTDEAIQNKAGLDPNDGFSGGSGNDHGAFDPPPDSEGVTSQTPLIYRPQYRE